MSTVESSKLAQGSGKRRVDGILPLLLRALALLAGVSMLASAMEYGSYYNENDRMLGSFVGGGPAIPTDSFGLALVGAAMAVLGATGGVALAEAARQERRRPSRPGPDKAMAALGLANLLLGLGLQLRSHEVAFLLQVAVGVLLLIAVVAMRAARPRQGVMPAPLPSGAEQTWLRPALLVAAGASVGLLLAAGAFIELPPRNFSGRGWVDLVVVLAGAQAAFIGLLAHVAWSEPLNGRERVLVSLVAVTMPVANFLILEVMWGGHAAINAAWPLPLAATVSYIWFAWRCLGWRAPKVRSEAGNLVPWGMMQQPGLLRATSFVSLALLALYFAAYDDLGIASSPGVGIAILAASMGHLALMAGWLAYEGKRLARGEPLTSGFPLLVGANVLLAIGAATFLLAFASSRAFLLNVAPAAMAGVSGLLVVHAGRPFLFSRTQGSLPAAKPRSPGPDPRLRPWFALVGAGALALLFVPLADPRLASLFLFGSGDTWPVVLLMECGGGMILMLAYVSQGGRISPSTRWGMIALGAALPWAILGLTMDLHEDPGLILPTWPLVLMGSLASVLFGWLSPGSPRSASDAPAEATS